VTSRPYRLFGLRIRSDVPLPLPETWDVAEALPDCTFTLAAPTETPPTPDGPMIAGLPCHGPCHNGSLVTTVHRGAGGTWFWYDSIGTCHVSPSGRQVVIYPAPMCDARVLGLMLTGQVMTFALHQLGYPSLHASAVEINGQGVAFLGLGGYGKSTLAASFIHRGATLMSDDVLPLCLIDGEVYAIPSFPVMKVWQQTAEHALHLTADLPTLAAHVEKRLLSLQDRYSFSRAPAPLRAVYVIDRYDPEVAQRDDVTIERINGNERLTTLLAQASNRAYLLPGENATLLSMCARLAGQAPVSVLSYPDGFGYQNLVHGRILADMAEDR
jgi:hypothetical protein